MEFLMNTKIKERATLPLGIAICFAVAGLSVLVERLIPGELLGASIIALFMGTIINSFFHPAWIKPALKFTSKKILKLAIILLGASLSVSTIMTVGKMTFLVMIFTFALPTDRTAEYTLSLRQNGEDILEPTVVSPDTTSIQVSLSGSGVAYYELYIDGAYYKTERVEFTVNG